MPHGAGATVLWGRCDEELGVAYQPFAEALRQYVEICPIDDLSAHVDLLVVNAVEAEMICGVVVTSLSAATEAAALLSEQVTNVVVTAGGLGLAAAERGNTPYAEAAHRVKLIDTHGAGDLLHVVQDRQVTIVSGDQLIHPV